MPVTITRRNGTIADLAALHDALACASTALVHAWCGDQDSASVSLIEAHAAAEEAFGCGSTGADALDVVLAAITEAASAKTAARGRP